MERDTKLPARRRSMVHEDLTIVMFMDRRDNRNSKQSRYRKQMRYAKFKAWVHDRLEKATS